MLLSDNLLQYYENIIPKPRDSQSGVFSSKELSQLSPHQHIAIQAVCRDALSRLMGDLEPDKAQRSFNSGIKTIQAPLTRGTTISSKIKSTQDPPHHSFEHSIEFTAVKVNSKSPTLQKSLICHAGVRLDSTDPKKILKTVHDASANVMASKTLRTQPNWLVESPIRSPRPTTVPNALASPQLRASPVLLKLMNSTFPHVISPSVSNLQNPTKQTSLGSSANRKIDSTSFPSAKAIEPTKSWPISTEDLISTNLPPQSSVNKVSTPSTQPSATVQSQQTRVGHQSGLENSNTLGEFSFSQVLHLDPQAKSLDLGSLHLKIFKLLTKR